MLIYNTTYHLVDEVEKNFLIWIKESVIPTNLNSGLMKNPRMCKLLSHQEAGNSSYTLQWEVDNTAVLHEWHMKLGAKQHEEMGQIFGDKVISLPTLMEEVDE